MNKILSLFLLMVFLSGCVPSLVETEEMAKKGIYKIKEELQKELNIEEYVMHVEDTVVVDNKVVRLESFNADYEVVFDVEGHKVIIKTSRDPLIVEGLELTIVPPFTYDSVDVESNYVKVRIVRFVPEEDQYLFYLGDVKEVLGHKVELVKIDKEGAVDLMVDRINSLRLMEDKTEAVANLYVSNVRGVYRAIASERHVILKIVEKP